MLPRALRSWDFLTLALAVNAADNVLERAQSPDGWTRQIELEVVLYEPEPYQALTAKIEEALRFLTGDFWTLTFTDGGYPLRGQRCRPSSMRTVFACYPAAWTALWERLT